MNANDSLGNMTPESNKGPVTALTWLTVWLRVSTFNVHVTLVFRSTMRVDALGHITATEVKAVVVVVIGTAVVAVDWPAMVVAMVGGNVVVPPAATRIKAMFVWFSLST